MKEAYGLRSQDIILVQLERGISFVISILSIWMINCVYCPINSKETKERTQVIFDSLNAKIIITSDVFSRLTSTSHEHTEKSDHLVFAKEEDNAYIITTSGTTGISKFVLISHSSFSHLLQSMINEDKDLWMSSPICHQTASCTFDPHLSEIFLPLILGTTLVIPLEEVIAIS